MEEDKNSNINRRRKSIMVIDKKGQAKEVSKNGSKVNISTLIDSTDKTIKSRANTVDTIEKDLSNRDLSAKDLSAKDLTDKNLGANNLTDKDLSAKLGNNDLNNSKLINKGLSDSNLNVSKVNEDIKILERSSNGNISIKSSGGNSSIKSSSENSSIKSSSGNNSIKSSSGNNSIKSSSGNNSIKSLNESRLIDNTNSRLMSSIGNKIDENKSNTNEVKTLSMKKSSNDKYRNVEIAAGATAGAAAEVLNIKYQQDKHVTINEQENEEHEVSNDGKSIPLTETDKHNLRTRSPNLTGLNTGFSPQRIPSSNLNENSGIIQEREKNNVEAEGHFYKRRRIFACFWHEKYFLLTKTGILKYYKANGTRVSKGNWDLRNIQRIHEVFMGGESHPFRLALMNGEENLLFGFDDSDNREYWLIKLSKYINK